MEPSPEVDASPATAGPRVPASVLALVMSILIAGLAGAIVSSSYDTGGCDGGLCVLGTAIAVFSAIVTWLVAFPSMWLLIRLGRRRR